MNGKELSMFYNHVVSTTDKEFLLISIITQPTRSVNQSTVSIAKR